MADREVVLYEEQELVGFITLNRPEKKNTLTDAVIQGIADGIDRATASADVRAIVLRGAGGVFCAGYDLTGEGGWTSPFDAPHPEPRAGAWNPVRDWQFMGHNVRRFMKLWECPKPVIGQIEGWCLGGPKLEIRHTETREPARQKLEHYDLEIGKVLVARGFRFGPD